MPPVRGLHDDREPAPADGTLVGWSAIDDSRGPSDLHLHSTHSDGTNRPLS